MGRAPEAAKATPRGERTINAMVKAMEESGIGLGYDELACAQVKTGPLPWDETPAGRAWSDVDDAHLAAFLQDRLGVQKLWGLGYAVEIYSRARSRNPLTDLLGSLAWDGVERAGRLLHAYLGARDDAYTACAEQVWMCGALERAYSPGVKFDHVLTLVGPGGIGKSTFGRTMALGDGWFCDCVRDLGDPKSTGEVLRGKWIVELAELTGMTGKSLEGVKAGITRASDTFRPAYGKRSAEHPRRCAFLATTNSSAWLRANDSAARRFLPVPCGEVEAERHVWDSGFAHEARQAWAEVRTWRENGDPRYRLTLGAEEAEAANAVREGFVDENPMAEAVRDYLERLPLGRIVCTHEVIDGALGLEHSNHLCRAVSRVLTESCPGWAYVGKRLCGDYGKQRAWERRGEGAGGRGVG